MKKFAFLALSLLFCVETNAQLNKEYFTKLQAEQVATTDLIDWRQVGPGMAGYCEEFWCHPTDKNVIMMSPDMYNTYGSWDAGKTWHTVKDVNGDGLDLARVRKFTFSYQHPSFGMAICGNGKLYSTIDTGRSWKEIKKFKGKFAELAVDPSDDKVWFAAPGDFWNVKKNHRHQNGQTSNVENDGIYRSMDGGRTWEKLTIGNYTDLDIGRIVVDPTDGKVVVAITNQGVFRSTNRGKSWKPSSDGLPVNRPRDLDYYFDKNTKEFILYMVEQTAFESDGKTVKVKGGVFKSTDHGKSWQSMTGNLAVDFNQISSRVLKDKYWKSLAFWFQEDVKTIQAKYPELPNEVFSIFHRIQVNPNNKDEVYLSQNNKHDKAFLPGGAWKTADGGKTWIAAARAGKYWIEGKDNAYWQSRNNPIGANTTFAHLQPEINVTEEMWGNRFLEIGADGRVYICLDQQVMASDNHGKSWEQIDDNETEKGSNHWVGRGGSNLPGRFMLLETGIKDRYLLSSGEHGLWQTAPLGNYPDKKAVAVKQLEGQNNHGGAHSISTVAVHPKNPDIIYFLSWRQEHRGKLRRSTDGGKTWENIATIFEAANSPWMGLAAQNSLLIDPVNPDNMYFCATRKMISEVAGPNAQKHTKGDYGFYRSMDGGYTWELSNNGLHKNASIRRIAMHPDHSEMLYAAVNDKNGGLFVTKDKGSHWEEVKIPSEIDFVNNVFIDRNTKDILIACGNEQATDQGGGVWRSRNNGKSWEKIFDMPYIWQVETSPINPKIITVSAALPIRAKSPEAKLNAGAYLSMDGGKTWHKVNKNLGQQDRITDFKPDPYREDVFWMAQKGSGWTVGYFKGTSDGWAEQ
ncbi:hypothetical protein V6R21_00780 [Limibacter armeniacum]|uniref:VPS10 domain-containing protein n=1 Tax=Limibacter armeniacum TaxID=466084 RepID=UPI002FE65597